MDREIANTDFIVVQPIPLTSTFLKLFSNESSTKFEAFNQILKSL